MWSYLGRKRRIIRHYPAPRFDTIIEPFAGTACYALHEDNWQRNVILRDVNPQIIRLWLWLRDHATPELIRCLPDVARGEKVPELPTEAAWLTGFWVNQGTQSPRKTAGWGEWTTAREQIAKDLHKIRHWDIALGDYASLPNIKASWFIDPPYQTGGHQYRYCERIDYLSLAEWCKTRRGQAIVCEGGDAEWLPFELLTIARVRVGMQTEKIWTGGVQ